MLLTPICNDIDKDPFSVMKRLVKSFPVCQNPVIPAENSKRFMQDVKQKALADERLKEKGPNTFIQNSEPQMESSENLNLNGKLVEKPCFVCGLLEERRSLMENHWVKHYLKSCNDCLSYFYGSENHWCNKAKHNCDFCDFSTVFRDSLKKHIRWHIRINKNKFTCKICGKMFRTDLILDSHLV